MQTVFATCGLAFSGKTTLAKLLAETLSIPRVNLDQINAERGLHGGKGMTDAQWEESSAIAAERLKSILASGQSLVLDDTLSHRFLRDRYRDAATEAGADFVLLFVDTPLAEIAERMEKNRKQPSRHDVSGDVFTAHRDSFQRPTEDEQPIHFKSTSDIDRFLASVKSNVIGRTP
ncbi:MAG: ATP-binding protein [Pseudomonadota bacterium]